MGDCLLLMLLILQVTISRVAYFASNNWATNSDVIFACDFVRYKGIVPLT